MLRISSSILCKSTRLLLNSAHRYATERTCLYDFHISQGAKMVPFAGWEMPVQYKTTISEEHIQVRKSVGIFDVSHMLQSHVSGTDRCAMMESLVVGDISGLKDNTGTLTVFTNDKGGILDDLIVSSTDLGYLYVVSNAGCIDKDWANMAETLRKLLKILCQDRVSDTEVLSQAGLPSMHMLLEKADGQAAQKAFQEKGFDVKLEQNTNALIAVQGPLMAKALQPLVDFDLSTLPFMSTQIANIAGVKECRVTRCGYTGEDGVEISIPQDKIVGVIEMLLSSKEANVKMIGLGARDSLRLEAGLCLYGNDIDESTTPVEASLTWVVAKRRRASADFPGADIILRQISSKPTRRRVGFLSKGPPARSGAAIYDESGDKVIGKVTSGCPSPYLQMNIAMGYVERAFAKNGTAVKFEVRKKLFDAQVSKMPFVPSNYYIQK